jgi:hypothetical protein
MPLFVRRFLHRLARLLSSGLPSRLSLSHIGSRSAERACYAPGEHTPASPPRIYPRMAARLPLYQRTSLRTYISARGWRAMRSNVYDFGAQSLATKNFRASAADDGQPRVEISGFGVRVPGGAPKAQVTQVAWVSSCSQDTFYSTLSAACLSARPDAQRPSPRDCV